MRHAAIGLALAGALLLGACGGSGGSDPSTILVEGTVFGMDGLPRALVPVAVLGRQAVATGSDGSFHFVGVQPPYDVAVFDPGGPQATVYEGLTRADPKLVLYEPFHINHSTQSGIVLGGLGFPTPAGVKTVVSVVGRNDLEWGVFANALDGTWEMSNQIGWTGPIGMVSTLAAFQYSHDANGNPIDYKGWDVLSVPIHNNVNIPGLVLDMTDPGTMSISGTYVPAPGTNFDFARLTVDLDPVTHVPVVTDQTSSSGTFQIRGPLLSGVTYTAEVQTEAVGGVFSIARATNLPAYASGVVLDTMPLYLVTGPPEGATNVSTDTEFTFNPSILGLHMLAATTGFGNDFGNPSFYVVTTATTIRIPDLSAYGLGLPSLVGYSWSIHAWGPFDSVDDMAGVGSLWAPEAVAYHCRQAVRTMTTAP